MELKNIISQIKENNLDYYLLATKSEFDVEYLPDYAKDLELLTGFDGSNGFCFLSPEKIIFVTDGRYILQAEKQFSKLPIELKILNLFDDDFKSQLDSFFTKKTVIGYNSKIFTKQTLKYFENQSLIYQSSEITIQNKKSVINKEPAFIYEEKYCGLNYKEKISHFANQLKADYYFFNCPASICWLLNIRGLDILHNLIFLCYGILEKNTKTLTIFCDDINKLEIIKNYQNIKIDCIDNLNNELQKIVSSEETISVSDQITIYYQNLLFDKIKFSPLHSYHSY
jgi:Xaa-Pro aminopeptidase